MVAGRGTTVTYQWNGWSPRTGPLLTITLYGTSPRRDSTAATARRVARATASSASSGVVSNVGPASAVVMRVSYGLAAAQGHQASTASVTAVSMQRPSGWAAPAWAS